MRTHGCWKRDIQPPPRKRKYDTIDQRLKQLTKQYTTGEKRIDEYINAVHTTLLHLLVSCISFAWHSVLIKFQFIVAAIIIVLPLCQFPSMSISHYVNSHL